MSSGNRRSFLERAALVTGGALFGWKSESQSIIPRSIPTYDYPEKYTLSDIRDAFPLRRDKVYFNTAGLGASPQAVIDTVTRAMQEREEEGETGRKQIEAVRNRMAAFINADPREIAFTRNATEGVNIVARGLPLQPGDEVILSTHEHVGGSMPWMAIAKEKGVKLKLLDLRLDGSGLLEDLKAAISPNTKAVFISHILCSTGMQLPVKALIEIARNHKIYSCIDGAQALGQVSLDMDDLNPDFYIASGHKWLFGPKGTGMLFINKNTIDKIQPSHVGAYTNKEYDLPSRTLTYLDQASREEYGTRNTPITLGIGAAIKFIQEYGMEKTMQHGNSLATRLKKGLADMGYYELCTPMAQHLSSAIVTFRTPDRNYPSLQKFLMKEYSIRTRGAYEGGVNGIRISCALYNDEEEIDLLLQALERWKKH